MVGNNHNRKESQFQEAWKQWLAHAPQETGREAAHRIAQRVGTTHRFLNPWVPIGAVAALLLSVSLSYLSIHEWSAIPKINLSSFKDEPAPLQNGVILMWIDDRTPLYMNYQFLGESLESGGTR